ncbi:MAG: hypothetical protein WA102_01450 [Candidatus Methanoperedens sp.]
MIRESAFGDEKINERIEKFDAYKERFTLFLLDYYWVFVPLYLIIGIPLDRWILYPENKILNSSHEAILGAITTFIVAFLSTRLSKKIPYTFKRIWDRNIISSKGSEKDIQDEFITFLDNFEKDLNSKIGVIWGVMWVSILLSGVVSSHYTQRFLVGLNNIHLVVFAIFLLFFGFYLYIGGIILYRMYVTAKYIRKISREFDISIQILHPDKCGGLKPIGDLCLSNSFILIVMGIYFAIAIAIARREEYSFAYGLLLLSVIVISILAFILPVNYIHKIMLKEKIKTLEILDRVVGDQIPVINKPKKMELSEINKIKECEVLLEQYKEVEEFNTWPFDTSIWRKFIASEIVLIFTWVTTGSRWLGENDKNLITNTFKAILAFFGIPS